ncbi:hypothetical protein GCM10017744_091550 [Streptomyces antimycoticus]|uniref:Uncharacterized protein n=1 Tax=Streptomyces antimycoticus TaxID=68175 RepID=A0A4D4JRW5_9ACTN|nr:hypothetical protein SANT12839_003530 [Streptomyces antimycoticus]
MERAGLLTRPRGHGFRLRSARAVPADTETRRGAEERRVSDEPVLAALLAEAGIGEDSSEARENLIGDAVATVLAAVGDAVTRLESVRLRRDVENAGFDNMWRA